MEQLLKHVNTTLINRFIIEFNYVRKQLITLEFGEIPHIYKHAEQAGKLDCPKI